MAADSRARRREERVDLVRGAGARRATASGLSGFKPVGEASFAGYDPPTTLPLLRRNELWVEIEEQIV